MVILDIFVQIVYIERFQLLYKLLYKLFQSILMYIEINRYATLDDSNLTKNVLEVR